MVIWTPSLLAPDCLPHATHRMSRLVSSTLPSGAVSVSVLVAIVSLGTSPSPALPISGNAPALRQGKFLLGAQSAQPGPSVAPRDRYARGGRGVRPEGARTELSQKMATCSRTAICSRG